MIKDYDVGIHYHPGKANVVADVLSRRPNLLHPDLSDELAKLNICVGTRAYLNAMEVKPTLEEEIKQAQQGNLGIEEIKARVELGKATGFSVDKHGTLRFGTRLCVLDKPSLKQQILQEAHASAYSIHPEGMKMYQDLK